MSADSYGQGQGGREQHLRQQILTRLNEGDEHFQPSPPNTNRSHAWQEQRYVRQDLPMSYQELPRHQDGQIQQHLLVKPVQNVRREEKVAVTYSHQAAFSTPPGHGSSPISSPGLDGQSLYCTEVLPIASPPSQPVTVEGGGTSRRSLVAVNGGAGSQQVQYTIIITDPQLQQASSNTSGATNILLNTLVQQQHLHLQQQQLQQHPAVAPKANSGLSGLLTAATSADILASNSSTVNGTHKLGGLVFSGNNLTTDGATFPATLIANTQSSFSDGKSIQFAKLTLTSNKLTPTVKDSGSLEGGILILNYPATQIRTGAAAVTNSSPLVSAQSKVPNLVAQDSAQNLADANVNISVSRAGTAKTNQCDHSDGRHGDNRTRGSAVIYNGQVFVDHSGDLAGKSSQPLQFSDERQLFESATSSDNVSGGMHSGRSGSGQGHSSHPQQQPQGHSPVSSSSNLSPAASATTSNQSDMLSAGQPAVPSGIFRTGADNTSSSQRLSSSGNSSYVPAQYSSIYGLHVQPPQGHLTTIQPYSTFFPSFGGSAASGHRFSHGSLMTGVSPGHYPHIESYSAMLASMGSHAQHLGGQGPERAQRLQAPVTQHAGPFLPSPAHPGVQYSSITAPHRRPSGSSSPSPGPSATLSPPSSSTHLDPLSSHHLEKMAIIKGGSGRDVEASREITVYGDSSSLHEDKPSLSPSGSYPAGTHIPKVSFDTVVKEYGGGRDSPTGRGDPYFRASLSGKEGSLKHRILTRPSDSDMTDDLFSASGIPGLKDEPATKRPKMASVGSAALSYGSHSSQGHHSDIHRPSGRHHSTAHTSSHHSAANNGTGVDSRGSLTRLHKDSNMTGRDVQHSSSYRHHRADADTRYQQYPSPSPTSTPPSTSPSGENLPESHLQYPSHFVKGSIIQLANGNLKRVEDLQTEDFVNSAEISSDLKVDSSTVVRIEEHPSRGTAMLSFSVGEHKVQVTVEATLEHPFFVFGQGWSSCSVSRTLARYGLDCQKLNVGDVCISLTHKDVNLKPAEMGQQGPNCAADAHGKPCLMTSSAEHPIATSQSTSSMVMSATSSSIPSTTISASTSSSTLKSETKDTGFLPPLPSSTSASSCRRRLSQTELPPPSSNVVLVKKESNNGHSSRRRGTQRVEDELREEELEDDDQSDSTLSLRKRRWSAPDPGSVKAEQERECQGQAQKPEEASPSTSSDNCRP